MIHILIVDDQKTIRESIGVLLEQVPEFHIVGTANNGIEAIAQVDKLKPDVVLMDLEMPELDGLEATEIISQCHKEVKVLILTSLDRDDAIDRALDAGAVGYLLKNMSERELIKAIRYAFEGHTEIKPSIGFKKSDPNPISQAVAPDLSLGSNQATATKIAPQIAASDLDKTYTTPINTDTTPESSAIPGKKSVFLGGLIGLSLFISAIAIFSLLKSKPSDPIATAQAKETSEAIETAKVTPSKVIATGKLLPEGGVIKISAINAQDSRVEKLLVQEGDFVVANQTIAILQGKEKAQQQLRDAQANVEIKQGQLSRIQQGEAKQGEIAAQLAVITEIEARLATETRQKEAQISQAEATLRNAQGKYQRYTPLAQQGAIGVSLLNDVQEELEKAKGALVQLEAELEHTESTLQAKLAQEKANLAQLQEVRPIDVAIAQAELKQAQIQVEQYKAELDNTNVRVPVAGQILRINTRVGEQVNVQQGIAELGQTKQIYAIAEIQETDITKISLGQPATIKSEYGGFEGAIKGTVAKIGLQIGKSRIDEDRQNPDNPANDLNERVVEVKIRLNPEDSSTVAAFTGMQVKVNIDVTPQ